MARVHPLIQQIDRLAFAGPVNPCNQNKQGSIFKRDVTILLVYQLNTQVLFNFLKLVLRQLRICFGFLKHLGATF